MPEILQIFHQPPPLISHNEMHPQLQRNVESQIKWSLEESEFQSSELVESPFTNFSSCSVDELSKVTSIIERNQNLKKRKLEFDVIEVDSRKQSAEGDSSSVEPPTAKTKRCNGSSKPKTDYIHVRARRGQATDSHSLAERARREKIKKKMQFLQDLVPGCDKISNKAAILDEIITYVQCLQSEVEFLTMRLAASTTSVADFQYEEFIA